MRKLTAALLALWLLLALAGLYLLWLGYAASPRTEARDFIFYLVGALFLEMASFNAFLGAVAVYVYGERRRMEDLEEAAGRAVERAAAKRP